MSSITFPLLLLHLLLLSLHACDAAARNVGVFLRHDTSKEVDQPQNSFKENEKLGPARVSNEAERKVDSLPNINISRDIAKDTENEEKAVSKRSEERVGWRVPDHRKGGQPEPGFNLDYLPPKTHPPVHN